MIWLASSVASISCSAEESRPEPACVNATPTPPQQSARLVLECVRPYRGWLLVVFVAMLMETAASIAAPWPLKILIDNVVGQEALPESLSWLRLLASSSHSLTLAAALAVSVVLIAAIGAAAGYIDSYYTERVAQHVANDLLLADGLRAIVGSINLAPGSFDDRRELAIELDDDDVVERLDEVARRDWENSHPLDLTDEGLLADLVERRNAGAKMLVLEDRKRTTRK